MSKAVLIIDMPRCCGECDLACDDIAGLFCIPADKYFDRDYRQKDRPDWCPLLEVESKQFLSTNLV